MEITYQQHLQDSGEPLERARVRVLPDGRMSREDAALYLGCTAKTLAMWALTKIGPRFVKVGGRVFYFKWDLDVFIRGAAHPDAQASPREPAINVEFDKQPSLNLSLDLLARGPIEAALRAEPHKDRVEIVIRALGNDAGALGIITVGDPRQTFDERRALARNVVRRINRDISMLSREGESP